MGSHIFRFLGQGSSSYLRLENVPEWTVALNICPPSPFEDLPFLLTTEDWLKLHSPLKTSMKNVGLPLKNMGLCLKSSVKIKASHPKNSTFFYSTPKEILNFCNLTLENSMFPQPEGCGY